MNYTTAITLVDDRVRIVNVTFTNPHDDGETPRHGKSFSYKTLDQSIVVGNFVVVPTGATPLRYLVARVVSVDCDVDVNSTIEYKWVIQRVDFAEYDRVIGHKARVIDVIRKADRREKRAELARTLINASVQEEVRALIDGSADVNK